MEPANDEMEPANDDSSFDKPKEECVTFEDRFLYIMKNLPTFAEKPDLWDDPYFDDIMEEAEFANMTFEEQEKYIASMKQKWDYQNTLDFAAEKAYTKGIAEGEAKGKAEGKAEGKTEGKTEKSIEIARKMLAKGYSFAEVAEMTELTEEQVRALMR